MNIAVLGLGLMGGSFAKALKKYTEHRVFGFDINNEYVIKAKRENAIDDFVLLETMDEIDLAVLALHPLATVDTALKVIPAMKKGSTLIDICGIKSEIVKRIEPCALENEIDYIGCHPMAGRELWGFDASNADLFKGASFIIAKTENTSEEKIKMLEQLTRKMLFRQTVITTPEEHDKIIAYTSQLAHVVSNAFVKSPSLLEEKGFSAGSFLDLTRVAYLNEDMWTELFIMNRDPLLKEVECIIDEMIKYRDALEAGDSESMRKLLREGRELKEESNRSRVK